VKHRRDLTMVESTFRHGRVCQGWPAKVGGGDTPGLLLLDEEEGVSRCLLC